MPTISPLARALRTAVDRVRARVGDPVAPVLVLTPADGNAALARQQLALAGDFVRVEFSAHEAVVRVLGQRVLAARGLRPEPRGWAAATVGALVRGLPHPRYGPILRARGWRGAVTAALQALELAGVDAAALARAEVPADYRERIEILALLLAGLAERRAAERLCSIACLCHAARAGVDGGPWAGVVLLGDSLLPPMVYEVLRDWLARRPVVEVLPDAQARLAPAPHGLRAAVAGAEVVPVPSAEIEVALVRTADDVRELQEAAREVVRAVRDGVPLDGIAIVLPDAAQVEVLRAALAAAEVPATWHVGPPLAQTPSGRFLMHALTLVTGAGTVPEWYELLRQPGLRLETDLAGRTRWRRVLAGCGAVADADTIVRAIAEWSAGRPADADADRSASANLIAALHALKRALAPLHGPGTLGDHARRWVALLRERWTASPDRERLVSLLLGLGSPALGPVLDAAGARDLLQDVLAAAPVHTGTFSQAAVRVVSPMGLLGGAFARVIVTGLVEGRFPRAPDEDTLLPDDLLAALGRSLAVPLRDSRAVRAFEDRRFAAVRSACTERLWLSVPVREHLEGRPLTPSRFALEVAAARAGAPVGYRDLPQHQVAAGSRARAGSERVDGALGALEHELASVREDPRTALRRLAQHPIGRRLLGLQRAVRAREPSRWTGKVAAGLIAVPGWEGDPLSAWDLALLVRNPAAFFVEKVLGVRSAEVLSGRSEPLGERVLQEHARAALADTADRAAEAGAFFARWEALVEAWGRHRVDVDAAAVAEMRAASAVLLEAARIGGAIPRGDRVWPEGKVDPTLPWVVRGDEIWVDGAVAHELRKRKAPIASQLARDADRFVLSTLALPAAPERLWVGVVADGKVVEGEWTAAASAVRAGLVRATGLVAAGSWPWGGEHPVQLVSEREDA